jgi:hypothetical protein
MNENGTVILVSIVGIGLIIFGLIGGIFFNSTVASQTWTGQITSITIVNNEKIINYYDENALYDNGPSRSLNQYMTVSLNCNLTVGQIVTFQPTINNIPAHPVGC